MTTTQEGLARRIARTIRHDVQSSAAYAIQPSAGMVKLDAMENPFALPPELQRALGDWLSRVAINRYPVGKPELCAALARHFDIPAGCSVMVGNGSDELIDLLSVACNVPGATVLAPLPGFVLYELSARLRGFDFQIHYIFLNNLVVKVLDQLYSYHLLLHLIIVEFHPKTFFEQRNQL